MTDTRAEMSGPHFRLTHVWLPLTAFVLLACVGMLFDGDRWLADRLYAWQGYHWAFQHGFWTEQVIHRLGRDLSMAAWFGVLTGWVVTHLHPAAAHLRGPLAYLAAAALLGTALVAWFKSWSNMDCPWDLLEYGGTRPFVGLLEARPAGLGSAACFPAGHASAGYAWLSLYFFLGMVRPSWRAWGLLTGLGAGLLFGVAQQLRGAHFLSHDVVTAAICWFGALTLFALYRRRSVKAEATGKAAG